MNILFLLLNMVIGILFMIIQCVIFHFFIKHSANKSRKENMNKIDFSRDKEYYRTILKTYSPAELSYIDDFKVNYKREIVSTILSLELKGKVKIENDGIMILNNNDENNVIKVMSTILGFIAFFIIWIEVIYGTVGTFIYYIMQINSYRRTEKGEEINKNIEGLKQYINDYSLLKDKDKEALMIW